MKESKPEDAIEETSAAPQPEAGAAKMSEPGSLDLVIDLPVRLSVEVGGTNMLVRDVLQLGRGSVVELDRDANEPADILVNGRIVARGQVTTIEDRL
ncbi:MAG: FliM/FliN family flagellar motor switch protein, partial [Myxococcales bacterium]|nr:FliM/FliN family flagellar motor switch protein [Myxococcales bacterium]